MADSNPLAGLLDRAGNVFSLARELGRALHDEGRWPVLDSDQTIWQSHAAKFQEYCDAVLVLRDAIENPPEGFGAVAVPLMEAAKIAKEIRDTVTRHGGITDYLNFAVALNSLFRDGWEAVKQVSPRLPSNDPFAFVDAQRANAPNSIDTTPTLPKPPGSHVERAARDLPAVLANITPSQAGKIEVVASILASRLQEAGHLLAAAYWAIHEAVQAGRLEPSRIVTRTPGSVGPNGELHGGQRGFVPIPQGKPAPFDKFRVTATDALWEFWHSTAEQSEPAVSNADGTNFIERLLAGPANVELSPREMALLEAHLKQPISLSTIQHERRASPTGDSEYSNRRDKLKLIRDYNRNLRLNAALPAQQESPKSGDSLPYFAALLLHLRTAPDQQAGIALMDLPEALRNPDLLTVCEGDGLIEFIRRKHVYIGGGTYRKLHVEEGWDIAELEKPNRLRTREFVTISLNEQTDPEIRQRVRLSRTGDAEAARLILSGNNSSTAQYRATPTAETTTAQMEPKRKRSTSRGEGQTKLISALTKHHEYADGGCLNLSPIGNNQLAIAARVSTSTASAFFTSEFGGYQKYRAVCRDSGRLADSLKALNGEFSPIDLYGRSPPDEDDRDNDGDE